MCIFFVNYKKFNKQGTLLRAVPQPANKKVIVQCKYIPNIEDKNFFWLTEIYFTDSKIYKCIIGKNTIKSPKLNLKIIWNEITKEFFS